MLDVVELILYFNQLNQAGKGLKRLTLAQLKAENNSEKLKTKLGKYCILCTDQKS